MYASHKEIPNTYRKLIMEQTLEMRVKDVPLAVCNEIIREHKEMEDSFFEEYTKFTIEAIKDGRRIEISCNSVDEADDIMDEIIEFGDRSDVIMVLRQNDRLIRGYLKGQVIYPTTKFHYEEIPLKKVKLS
jgi:hypothetical protein